MVVRALINSTPMSPWLQPRNDRKVGRLNTESHDDDNESFGGASMHTRLYPPLLYTIFVHRDSTPGQDLYTGELI
jgi:hypothetical protein